MTAPLPVTNLFESHFVADLAMSREEVAGTAARLEDVAQFSTGGLVDAYRHANAVKKAAEEVTTAVRAELLTRLPDDPTGTVTFASGEGTIEARPRVAAKMDAAAMEALLKKSGLYSEAVDTTTVVTDPKQLFDTVHTVVAELRALKEHFLADHLQAALDVSTQERHTLNEKKVEKLVKAGKLDQDAAVACYATTTTYALYDTTPA